jgi:biopolymer transport protein TolQ
MITYYAENVNHTLLGSNPFFQAYVLSDWLGKFIFLALYFLSILSWIVLIYKFRQIYLARKLSHRFRTIVVKNNINILQQMSPSIDSGDNPFLSLFTALKKHSIELLNKNRRYAAAVTTGESAAAAPVHLSPSDVDFVQAHLNATAAGELQRLDQNLFILSTTVSLAPFLGLLGTVWGILVTFSSLQNGSAGAVSNQMVLGGLSLALATTILGLLDAIPALIGYNYLKSQIRHLETEMESFSTEIVAALEMCYRKVDGI